MSIQFDTDSPVTALSLNSNGSEFLLSILTKEVIYNSTLLNDHDKQVFDTLRKSLACHIAAVKATKAVKEMLK